MCTKYIRAGISLGLVLIKMARPDWLSTKLGRWSRFVLRCVVCVLCIFIMSHHAYCTLHHCILNASDFSDSQTCDVLNKIDVQWCQVLLDDTNRITISHKTLIFLLHSWPRLTIYVCFTSPSFSNLDVLSFLPMIFTSYVTYLCL